VWLVWGLCGACVGLVWGLCVVDRNRDKSNFSKHTMFQHFSFPKLKTQEEVVLIQQYRSN
jgi:hypothetical protein